MTPTPPQAVDPAARRPGRWRLTGLAAACALSQLAQAQTSPLPRRQLLVEVRVVRAADVDPGTTQAAAPRATSLGTRDLTDELPAPQQVRVANGQRGQVRYSRKLPVLWMDSVSTGGHQGSSASYKLSWLEAGQALAVTASWPGGRAPARVDLSVGDSTLEHTAGRPLPTRQTRSVSTTLVTPLARWTTFAAMGQAGETRAGQTLSTRDVGASSTRLLFQVRVSAD